MSEINSMLICPKCKEISKIAFECNGCSQLYCRDCTILLNNYCLKCKKEVVFENSPVGQKIINDLMINCQYCQLKIRYGDIETHYNNCEKYKLTCKYDICNFVGSRNDFIEHVLVFHKNELIQRFCQENCDKEFERKADSELFWSNGTKEIVKTGNGKFIMTSKSPLKKFTMVKLKFEDCKDYTYCKVGFSKTILTNESKFLEVQDEKGIWGLLGNGFIYEEGKLNKNFLGLMRFTDEEVTLTFNNGKIQVVIGDKTNSYTYNIGVQEAYLTIGLFHDGSKVKILSDYEMNG